MEYKFTTDMIIDGLIKSLITIKFDSFVNKIGMKKIAEKIESEASRRVL